MKPHGIALALAVAFGTAHAGRSCEPHRASADALARGLGLAEQTARELDASGARVALLARAGQDLSRFRLQWSHLGYAYREPAGWRVVHKLNQCGGDRASLYRQGLGQFFLDDPARYEAAFVPLAPALESRALALLRDNTRVAALDTPAYSMVAYPWSTRYQQSNQWALETLATIADPDARTREQAQAYLRLRGYRPSPLHLTAFERLGARLTRANVAFDDHPNRQRYADLIETVTVDSTFDWLPRSGLGLPVRRIP